VIQDPHELKRRSLLRLKSVSSPRPLIGPATVQFHITDLCNLACQYCFYHGAGTTHRPSGKKYLPFDLFKGLVRDCLDLQVDTIYLSGQGEPTLHPRFYDMLRCLEPSFKVNIYSNGTFPIERCRDILRSDHIVINLGEADRESYRALTGGDLFIKVIKNIRELARLRPKFNPDFFIEVLFVMTRLNAENLLRTENLVLELGADLVQKRKFEVSDFNRHLMLTDEEEKAKSTGGWLPCYFGWFNSAVEFNGDVNICCFMQSLTVGNAYKTSFKDVWGSDAYSRARILALRGEDPFRNDKACAHCATTCQNKDIAAQMEMYDRVRKA
jgi:MoaA/NifB/PqqE/SkfB family radical SAM enzyme